jgi:hypothetical protein
MHSCMIVVFAVEVRINELMYGTDVTSDTRHGERKLVRPMIAFLLFLGLESWMRYFISPIGASKNVPVFTSIFKPLVFFYVSAKARNSLEALLTIGQIVVRVFLVEFGLILTFASVACRMFGAHDSFQTLSISWVRTWTIMLIFAL